MTHKECPECSGWGFTTYDRDVPSSSGLGYIEEYTDDCQNCGGTGYIEYTEDDEDDDYDYDDFLTGGPNPGAIVIALMLTGTIVSFLVIVFIFVRELL